MIGGEGDEGARAHRAPRHPHRERVGDRAGRVPPRPRGPSRRAAPTWRWRCASTSSPRWAAPVVVVVVGDSSTRRSCPRRTSRSGRSGACTSAAHRRHVRQVPRRRTGIRRGVADVAPATRPVVRPGGGAGVAHGRAPAHVDDVLSGRRRAACVILAREDLVRERQPDRPVVRRSRRRCSRSRTLVVTRSSVPSSDRRR